MISYDKLRIIIRDNVKSTSCGDECAIKEILREDMMAFKRKQPLTDISFAALPSAVSEITCRKEPPETIDR